VFPDHRQPPRRHPTPDIDIDIDIDIDRSFGAFARAAHRSALILFRSFVRGGAARRCKASNEQNEE
jgi:hypothetical protein